MAAAEATERWIVDLDEVDASHVALVGGKGAQLGELMRIPGVRVPAGFCVTTAAYRDVIAGAPSIGDLLDQLDMVGPDDHEASSALSAVIRRGIEAIVVPGELVAAIDSALTNLGGEGAVAVRSSATAEDLPTASFAGQHDTYLNVMGSSAVVQQVSRCWASLFTERAVAYRRHHGIDHRTVQMAVVVQRMLAPQAAGVMFTADPVTSNRMVATVEASFGLGEAVVSGLVDPDVYRVRNGEVVSKAVRAKQRAVVAVPGGGTHELAVDAHRQEQPALTDAQVVELVQVGRRIEAHAGSPQDIEWCLVDDGGPGGAFHIVQSRPITTLFPVPAAGDDALHVYVSVGHQQMMTDPMKPLGWSMWQLTARPPMHQVAGRLFVEVTQLLASPATRAGVIEGLGRSDPLIGDALQTVVDRGLITLRADEAPAAPPGMPGAPPPGIETDPAIVAELIAAFDASNAALGQAIEAQSGPALFEFILADIQELKRMLFEPRSMQVIVAAMDASWWLNEQLLEWLGEKNAADTLTRSVPDNITSEMGLALLDVADAIRPHPDVVEFLQRVEDSGSSGDAFLGELAQVAGGVDAGAAIRSFLHRYGMRCVGEIDIARPRWSERPDALVPVILGNVRNFRPGEGRRRFEQGRLEAEAKQADLLARLRVLPDGAAKAAEAQQMIDRVRTFSGYREHPKYFIIARYAHYKRALLREADRLVQAGVLRDADDAFYLTLQELQSAASTHQVDHELVAQRRDAFTVNKTLTPPRVLTSEGECLTGSYRRHGAPAGALVGLAVSTGTVEGRARVIADVADADVEPGDILVTAHTDPSWSPLFVAVAGLVTEVGGLTTHGAVIAREYGLPAVVGVQHATRLIRDGQRIRVHGTDGYVEILT